MYLLLVLFFIWLQFERRILLFHNILIFYSQYKCANPSSHYHCLPCTQGQEDAAAEPGDIRPDLTSAWTSSQILMCKLAATLIYEDCQLDDVGRRAVGGAVTVRVCACVALRWQHWHIICVSAGVMHVIWPGVSWKGFVYEHIISLKTGSFILVIIQVLPAATLKSSQYLSFLVFFCQSHVYKWQVCLFRVLDESSSLKKKNLLTDGAYACGLPRFLESTKSRCLFSVRPAEPKHLEMDWKTIRHHDWTVS